MVQYRVIAYLTFFALFVAAIVILIRYRAVRRRNSLAALAREMGFAFQPEDRELLAQFAGLSKLPRGSSPRCVNVMRGKTGRITIWLFDYLFISRSGSKRSRQEYTICALRSIDLALPGFYLRLAVPGFELLGQALVKRGLVSSENPLAATLGVGDLDFAEDEFFSRKFVLQGEEEVRQLFAAGVRRQLVGFSPPVGSIEGGGDTLLLLYWHPLPPKSARAVIDQAVELVRLFAGQEGSTAAEASTLGKNVEKPIH